MERSESRPGGGSIRHPSDSCWNARRFMLAALRDLTDRLQTAEPASSLLVELALPRQKGAQKRLGLEARESLGRESSG